MPEAARARATYERLMASDVPKYTKRRNRFALHDMLGRMGEFPPRYGPGFHVGWHLLRDKGGRAMAEAHFFREGRFACDPDLHKTASSLGITVNRGRWCKACLSPGPEARAG